MGMHDVEFAAFELEHALKAISEGVESEKLGTKMTISELHDPLKRFMFRINSKLKILEDRKKCTKNY